LLQKFSAIQLIAELIVDRHAILLLDVELVAKVDVLVLIVEFAVLVPTELITI
jgi:hypothetical protein